MEHDVNSHHAVGSRAISLIDRQRIDELIEEISAEDLERVVTMFLQESDDAVARLTQQQPPAARAADLHSLKGSALNLGLTSLASLCQDEEISARDARPSQLDNLDLQKLYLLSKEAVLEALLAGTSNKTMQR